MNVCFYVSAVLYVQTKLYDNALGIRDGVEVDDGIYDILVRENYFKKCPSAGTDINEKGIFMGPFADIYDLYRYR